MTSSNISSKSSDIITSELSSLLISEGASIIGIADIQGINENPFPDLPVAVSIGCQLTPTVISMINHGPTEAYIQEYNRVNQKLLNFADICIRYIKKEGFRAVTVEPTPSQVYLNHLYDTFSHKTAATRAGIGWIGKCALLVTRTWGSAIRLTTVFSDAPLKIGQPVVQSECGECTICTNLCPASAPSGKNWNPGLIRDEFWDANACFLQCEKTQKNRQMSAQVCGICISICPYTQRFIKDSS
ncbi:epoxyqueuosine reductase [Methanospirillum lacunae]|uniref:Epoxyqueuosine reductase n=1 Tax=Methanospirillum lacunae TaxID=668570 RepID=A0A2V2NCC8_9EURY|nr:epoxyqueuosine reductase [Methanospirillum lacunae]PWR74098.1 epoxyqueuosine reductase [Methanospirillum lacunae]